ncbi:MAG: 4-hydroxythreonine-4-phosphate dehydrogenase PdxA [Planctomycetes bacterium]|nr:4-hydroxythreonine-4-phosphate dehydrogenase PdxA [Planctomycetota bacterium]MCP4769823.1 4-hydroxythreonine-4-phosphate dehydrogenase PdxA [Planctomycetota bacterium]MCP4859663.1 4-hydroxythreonine-4-phosphate dehydrogenase PdxA [Planctomycetota bacterium]
MRSSCRPVILGHRVALEAIAAEMGIAIELQSVSTAEEGFALSVKGAIPVLELESRMPATTAAPSAELGMASVEAVLRCANLCLEDGADVMVTPPLHKESMHLAGYPFEGQTQILGETCRSRRYGMLACAGELRVLVATRHMALRQAISKLDPRFVAKQIRLAHEAARQTLGLSDPRIVLSGLNPHAGENGAFGNEEELVLEPAIQIAKEEWDFDTAGPAVPDVVFGQGARGEWDIVIALYHDQAFLPLRMLPRETAYSIFVGGKILRTSPLHGTAYDIARSGKADARPFAFSLKRGIDLAKTRLTCA